jgi:hypothetical protein
LDRQKRLELTSLLYDFSLSNAIMRQGKKMTLEEKIDALITGMGMRAAIEGLENSVEVILTMKGALCTSGIEATRDVNARSTFQ